MMFCPYCKDIVENAVAFLCPVCRAAHHGECWDANGDSCSVYGCESRTDSYLLGCPWCDEVYIGRQNCTVCDSPLMRPDRCREFLDSHSWEILPLPVDANPLLTAGYLRNNEVVARITRKKAISMFHLDSSASIFVCKTQIEEAKRLLDQLSNRMKVCPDCRYTLFEDEEECSYCSEVVRNDS